MRTWQLPASAAGSADPSRDLLSDFKAAGFAYADSATSLTAATGSRAVPQKLLGLFGYGNMNVTLDKLAKRRNVLAPGATTFAVDDYHAPDQPLLPEMTDAALKVLSNRNRQGFVLMVEGAHIDEQSHLMDAERAVDEVIEFDNAVAVARAFAENVDRRTVVIVLADHEWSGFSIIGGLKGSVADVQALPPDGANPDPATAPARQKAVNTYDAVGFPRYTILPDGYPQTLDIDGKLLFGFGANGDRYETWATRPRPVVDSLLPANIGGDLTAAGYPTAPFKRSQADGYFIRGQAVGQEQAVHTASDIPVSAHAARAAWAMQFVGVQRNTDVFVKLIAIRARRVLTARIRERRETSPLPRASSRASGTRSSRRGPNHPRRRSTRGCAPSRTSPARPPSSSVASPLHDPAGFPALEAPAPRQAASPCDR